MKYSTRNLQVSLSLELAKYLREQGFDVYWHVSNVLEPQTAGLLSPRDKVTFVPEFPANPLYIVRLKSGTNDAEVEVPALSLQVLGSPRKIKRLGLGDRRFERERDVRVEVLAADEAQQKEMLDLLYDWAHGEDVEFPVKDYDSDPTDPPSLDSVWVEWVSGDMVELVSEIPTIRYYVQLLMGVRYIE